MTCTLPACISEFVLVRMCGSTCIRGGGCLRLVRSPRMCIGERAYAVCLCACLRTRLFVRICICICICVGSGRLIRSMIGLTRS